MDPKTCRSTETEIKVIAVQWKSRAAGFVSNIEGSTVESITQKACSHFRLGSVDKEYTLMTEVEGVELELTNDLLQHLKSGTVVKLQEASDEDCYPDNDSAAAVPFFSSAVDLNVPALASGSLPVDNSPQPGQSEGNGQRNHKALQFALLESTPANEDFRIFVTNSRERTWMVKAESSDTIGVIKQKLQDKMGMPSARQLLSYSGEQLEDGRTLSAYNIQNRARIHLGGEFGTVIRGGRWPSTRGGGGCGGRGPRRGMSKPVIYLFPRTHLPHATVTVTLTPDWSFSHVYPIVDAKVLDDGKQAVTWSVSADEDGTLVEKETMRELSYLFWEAHPNPAAAAPPSPPSTPPLATERNGFPTHASDSDSSSLEPDTPTAVMLPFTALLPYLDRVLKTLSLHTSARNDFITYWLPALSQAPFVALRFLPQAAYARDVGLRVEPPPDVVTRVFMLFRAVPAADAETWAAARARADAEDVDWVRVVGVGPDAFRPALFRVLEWGGMEVLGTC